MEPWINKVLDHIIKDLKLPYTKEELRYSKKYHEYLKELFKPLYPDMQSKPTKRLKYLSEQEQKEIYEYSKTHTYKDTQKQFSLGGAMAVNRIVKKFKPKGYTKQGKYYKTNGEKAKILNLIENEAKKIIEAEPNQKKIYYAFKLRDLLEAKQIYKPMRMLNNLICKLAS